MKPTVGRPGSQAAVRSLQLDDVTLTYVVDGGVSVDPAAYFPAVPAEYWMNNPDALDARGCVPMSTGGLLVERGEHRLLIDAGYGPARAGTSPASVQTGALLETLAALGHAPEDIDTLALTHVHADHFGWAVTDGPDGLRKATFPRAGYRVAEGERNTAEGRGRGPGAIGTDIVTAPLGRPAQHFTEGDLIAPGVTAISTPGHGSGHASYLVTTAWGRRVVAFGDTFQLRAQLSHFHWTSALDADPGRVILARARILAELEKPATFGFGLHFGDQPFGMIIRNAEGEPEWRALPTRAVLPTPAA